MATRARPSLGCRPIKRLRLANATQNLADFASLTVAYGALKKQLQQRYGSIPRPKLDGFTPEQRYFLSWAQLRRTNIRP